MIQFLIPYCGLFYLIYRYVFSEWRSIRPVKINQYDITLDTHYDIIMGNDIPIDVHCEITMSNDVAREIHCDVTMSNDFAMCTYHDITMHNDVTMNLFYYVFSDLCLIMLFSYGQHGIKQEQVSVWLRTHLLFLSRNTPTQTQLMCSPQIDQTLTCSCYNIYITYVIHM